MTAETIDVDYEAYIFDKYGFAVADAEQRFDTKEAAIKYVDSYLVDTDYAGGGVIEITARTIYEKRLLKE